MKEDEEEKGVPFTVPPLKETIEKIAENLRKNKWRHASARDVKRLLDKLVRLRQSL